MGVNITRNKWQRLTITDDFIFGNVIQTGDNCLNLLRAILPELKLEELVNLNTQKVVKDQKNKHGVRFDAFVEDNCHCLYDIEMQSGFETSLGCRVRYYQSKIDIELLGQGKSYKDLKQSFVIFITNEDHFGYGQYRYIFHSACDSIPELKFQSGCTWIVLNSKGSMGEISLELKEFFDLMNGFNQPTTAFAKKLLEDIESVKADPQKERAFMDWVMKLEDARDRANMESAINYSRKLTREGCSQDEIVSSIKEVFVTLTDDEINQILDTL